MKIGKKIFLMFLALVFLTLGAVGTYGWTLYQSSTSAANKTYNNLGRNIDDKVIEATKPLTILLMGVDMDQATRGGEWEGGRSDSMILVTVNPKTKTTTMMSLTRDIMVEIANADGTSYGSAEKLNHSYAYGQAPMAIATIEKMMDTHIDRYMEINMDGLRSLVDAVGGITVNNTLGFTISISDTEPAYTATVDPGKQHINGEQALVYSRMRYQDPEGDYGRQKRQREVISILLNKLLQLDGITQYQKILDVLANNMRTDVKINSSTIPNLLGYKDSLKKIESYQLIGEGQMVNEISYQIPTSEHLLEMQNVIKKSLDLEPATVLKTNVKVYENLFGYANPITVEDAFTGEVTQGTGQTTTTNTESTVSTESTSYGTSESDSTYQ